MNKFRFGILGCGLIGDVHARAMDTIEDVELVAMCDVSLERAEQYASKHGARAYSSYEEMLAADDIDAVTICTPSGMHADQAIAALKAGKHVLLEKPMALTSADADRIRVVASESGKLLSVVFQMRLSEDVQYLKSLIDEGRFGTLAFCDLYMKYWRDPEYYAASPWRGTFAMDGGGALMNQGIHGIDIMHYLCGTPKLIGAKVKTLVHNIETEDTAAAVVEYPSGALGVIEGSTSANPGFQRRIEILGSKGYAVINDASLGKLVIDGETLIDREDTINVGTASDPSQMSCRKHALQIKNFADSARGKAELISTADDGYAAVKFIEDIYNFSKTH